MQLRQYVRQLFDSHSADPAAGLSHEEARRFDFYRVGPFLLMHLACLTVFLVGWSWTAVAVAVGLYMIRMFAITGFYHRYFSHRSYKTNRFWQFVFAVLGNSSCQRGPLWWAAHHRHHHRHSDEANDTHSPIQDGLWWSHMGWFTCKANFKTDLATVPDLAKFPELVWLDRHDAAVPLMLAISLFSVGQLLSVVAPGLGTNGWQLLVWGFCISTIVTAHATFTINSLAHIFGKRRFETPDQSRNNVWLALLTFGEGWHNNHHHYQSSARQGFLWWEIDLTYYGLVVLSWLGIVRDLRQVPAAVLAQRH
ncbi:delta 9 acyl-lipid fatty acid desaturase [Planctomycetota bacterium]|nr:delta 9 acyl-lipid fatty acid desaturase [Planctomycetota bacterium]